MIRSMLDAPALPPPAVVAPAPREVSFGLVAGLAPRGTDRVVVRIGARVLGDRAIRGRSFSFRVDLPVRLVNVSVTAVDGARRSTHVVRAVHGLPRAAEPRRVAPRLDPALQRTVVALGRRGTTGIYVQDLRSGRGAAWNAKARFPAASTLKLAIAVAALRAAPPAEVGRLLRPMLVGSDNEAANRLLARAGGSWRVDETLRALGLRDSLMYGGYETRETQGPAPIPVRVERQPQWGVGKYTTAFDLALLVRAVYLAAAGRGPLPALGVTGAEARHVLWLLAQAGDRGKLDRHLGSGPVLMHKAGWLPVARHDAGVVAFARGAYVAAVLTYRTADADDLAGDVSLAALRRFGALR